MKEYTVNSGYVWHAWFWVDKEEFEGEWKIGKLRYRVESVFFAFFTTASRLTFGKAECGNTSD